MRQRTICGGHVATTRFAWLVCVSLAAGPAFAQGRSETAPGKTKEKPSGSSSSTSRATESSARASESGISSPVTATTSTSAPASSANALIYYGSWLDDASIVSPGDVWVGLSSGYWKGEGSRQVDAPVASVAVGISRRVQAGGSFSFYHFRDADGFADAGMGNMSLYGKFVLIDPSATKKAIGVAVTPLVELSPGAEDQVGWALPVNVEARRGNTRVYGSAGYFSRGSTFATIGLDLAVGQRAAITASLGQSYARAGTHQTSVGVGAFYSLSSTTGVFAGLGNTFTPIEVGPGGLSLAGGVSLLLPQVKQP